MPMWRDGGESVSGYLALRRRADEYFRVGFRWWWWWREIEVGNLNQKERRDEGTWVGDPKHRLLCACNLLGCQI